MPLLRELSYGEGYKYAHDYASHFVFQQYLPDELKDRRYYTPSDQGFEKELAARLEAWWGPGDIKKEEH